MSSTPSIVLGIDLGTTNSACAVVQGGKASVIRRGEDRIVPSVVGAREDGSIVVGNEAKRLRTRRPTDVVFSTKRLIGRRFSSDEVQRTIADVPFRIIEGPNESVMVELANEPRALVEISAFVLKYLRQMAEEALGQRVRKCVISVPANFTESQRSATRIAARLAGLDVIRVINEPTAAALAYGYIEDVDRRIAVYDFGGGTFDVTILQITRNVFEVLATSGEMFLGGDDIDNALLEVLVQRFDVEHGTQVRDDKSAVERLRAAAEQIKIELSESTSAELRLEDVLPGRSFVARMGRDEFERIARPIVDRTVAVCEDAMSVAGIGPEDIDDIVLVGGTTRLPIVRQTVERIFGQPPQTSINPLSVVAVGAAIQGAALMGSLVPMVTGGISAPSMATTAVLLDVTPRSLGVGTIGGNVDVIIERNAVIPVEQTRLFTTSADNQRYVRVEVCQGESSRFDENTKLGELLLSGLRSAPRGGVTVAVTFEINTDGLLEVRALDQDTGQEQVATMRVLGGLPQHEVDAILARSASR